MSIPFYLYKLQTETVPLLEHYVRFYNSEGIETNSLRRALESLNSFISETKHSETFIRDEHERYEHKEMEN